MFNTAVCLSYLTIGICSVLLNNMCTVAINHVFSGQIT